MIRRLLLTALAPLLASAAFAQAPDIPRAPDGKPDFQGVWDRHSLTQLERFPGVDKLSLTAEEAGPVIKAEFNRRFPGDVNQQLPRHLYPARSLNQVRGEFRTSQIVDPPSGKLPLTAEAEALRAKLRERFASAAQGPEQRPAQERCVAGAGRAPLVTVIENMTSRIVQTSDSLVLQTEHTNDLRIIRIGGVHWPQALVSWAGDSIARWEGDTLVIETTNARDDDIMRPQVLVARQSIVRERLTLIAPDELLYEYTVEDPSLYARPWKAEFSLRRSGGPMFEGACHEANYAMESILRGARETERRAAAKSVKPKPARQ